MIIMIFIFALYTDTQFIDSKRMSECPLNVHMLQFEHKRADESQNANADWRFIPVVALFSKW